ncbi:MAG: hypothetical protein Q9202_007371 [Teloschistes flavicans]
MPYTILAFITRRPTLSPSEFSSHYENTHIPLLRSLMGPTFPTSHTRFYLARTAPPAADPVVYAGAKEDFDYDVCAKLVFEDEAAFGRFFERMMVPEVKARIEEDEELFLDRERFRSVAVGDVRVTEGSGGE